MVMKLDNSANKENDLTTDDKSAAANGQPSSSTRRRFTRNAIVGSSVLLSLTNRAAWGYTGLYTGQCMSGPTWASFTGNGNAFASLQPDHLHSDEFGRDILELNASSTPIEGDVSCPDGTGGYCIQKGNNCP